MRKIKYKMIGKGRARMGLFFVVFLIFLFGVSSMIYMDSYGKTLEEQRKLSYGAWHVGFYNTTKEVYQDIEHHGMVKSTGIMEIFGYAVKTGLPEKQHILGGIGYADNAVIKMGNITLLNGDFPRNTSEIAVEAAVLDQMGLSYELGQVIKINFSSKLDNGGFSTKEITFTLCGVLKNYSAYWKSNGQPLASYFVSKEFQKGSIEPVQYVFAELKPQYMEYADDLSVLVNKGGHFVKNELTYLQYSETKIGNSNLQMQQKVMVVASCVFIFILLYMELKQQYNSFVMMRTIGATKVQIIGLFLRNKLQTLCVASSAGILCGILCTYLLFERMRCFGEIFTYYINITNVIVIIFVLYISGILSFILSMTSLFQIPLRGIVQQQVIKKKYYSRTKMGKNYFFIVFHRVDFKEKVIGVIVTCIALTFIYVVGYQVWNEYRLCIQYCENNPADYTFGLLVSKEPQPKTVPDEKLKEIKCAYGVEKVQTISMSDYYGISFEGDYNQGYAYVVQEDLSRYLLANNGETPSVEISGTLVGVSDNLMPLYINEMDSVPTINELTDGEVILYVPSYIKDKNGNLLMDSSLWNATDKSAVYEENTIKTGDTVQIETEIKIRELNIVGIIESFDGAPQSFNPMRSYSLICNENTYRDLVGSCEYAYVLVYGDDTTIPYQTDLELSKIQTSVYFKNNRSICSERLQNVILQIMLAVFLCTFVLFMMTVIRFGFHTMYEQQKKERYKILYKLGMSKWMMVKYNFYSNVMEGLIGCSIATFAFLVLQFHQRKQELILARYTKLDSLQFFWDICICVLKFTDWSFFGIFAVSVYLIDLCIMMIREYRFINRIEGNK